MKLIHPKFLHWAMGTVALPSSRASRWHKPIRRGLIGYLRHGVSATTPARVGKDEI